MMDELGICASSGLGLHLRVTSAPSHVLRAMGVPFTMAHGSVRFSLSIYNNEEEIDFVIDKMPPIIEKLRALSPYWKPDGKACASGGVIFAMEESSNERCKTSIADTEQYRAEIPEIVDRLVLELRAKGMLRSRGAGIDLIQGFHHRAPGHGKADTLSRLFYPFQGGSSQSFLLFRSGGDGLL